MRELFWKVLPEYLAIGMTAEEFWHGDLRLCKAYREAYAIERENGYYKEWRAGVYVFEALRAAAPAYREFSEGEQHAFPSRPIFTTAATKEAREEDEAKARMEQQKAMFTAVALRFNKRFQQEDTT